MTSEFLDQDCEEILEYHGNTMIELTRKQDGETVLHDWLLFNSVEEASEYFYAHGG